MESVEMFKKRVTVNKNVRFVVMEDKRNYELNHPQ